MSDSFVAHTPKWEGRILADLSHIGTEISADESNNQWYFNDSPSIFRRCDDHKIVGYGESTPNIVLNPTCIMKGAEEDMQYHLVKVYIIDQGTPRVVSVTEPMIVRAGRDMGWEERARLATILSDDCPKNVKSHPENYRFLIETKGTWIHEDDE